MAYDRPHAARRYTAGKTLKTTRFGEAPFVGGRTTGSERIFTTIATAETLSQDLAAQAMWMAEVAPGPRTELPIISGGCIISPEDNIEE